MCLLYCRYQEYIESQQHKEELVKVIHEKLHEYDVSNKAHEVSYILVCVYAIHPSANLTIMNMHC